MNPQQQEEERKRNQEKKAAGYKSRKSKEVRVRKKVKKWGHQSRTNLPQKQTPRLVCPKLLLVMAIPWGVPLRWSLLRLLFPHKWRNSKRRGIDSSEMDSMGMHWCFTARLLSSWREVCMLVCFQICSCKCWLNRPPWY